MHTNFHNTNKFPNTSQITTKFLKMTMDTPTNMKPEVKLISVTPDAEKHMAYCARVSNPNNQENDNFSGLLKYCIKHQHWSIFEQASMTVEINTTRGIAAQILRHRSFTFQEFSQRYADTNLLTSTIPLPDLRRQDTKNRQNSTDDLEDYLKLTLLEDIRIHFAASQSLYNRLLEHGVAKECARFVLPLATPTRLYMTGSVRSWIHYIDLRSAHGTQKEHMQIAEAVRCIFTCQFPAVSAALEWTREGCAECMDAPSITLE
jgi:thymidylate synthase (FAD)